MASLHNAYRSLHVPSIRQKACKDTTFFLIAQIFEEKIVIFHYLFVHFIKKLYLCAQFLNSHIENHLMKSVHSLSALMLGTMMFCVSCDEQSYIPHPGDNTFNQDSIIYAPDPDISMVEIPEGAITVDSARAICAALESGAVTTEKYYVKGWISSLHGNNESAVTNYGNAVFYMVDNRRKNKDKNLLAYQLYGKNGNRITSLDYVKVDDYVVIYGQLTNYNGTFETVGQGKAYIYSSSNPLFHAPDPEPTPDPEGAVVPEEAINVYRACDIADSIGAGKTTTEKYYIKGFISRLDSKHESGMKQYGNATFYVAAVDGSATVTREFEAYQVYGKDGKKMSESDMDKIAVGDFVVLYGQITNYNGVAETPGQGRAYISYSNNPNW